MSDYPQGLASMAPARLPTPSGGVVGIVAPFSGPDRPQPDAPVGEEVKDSESERDAVRTLIGKFNQEIDLSDNGRRTKEWAWMRIEKYLAGKDVNPPPIGYTESTFFYRRLPRITQIGKAKLFKHVCPVQGRPWEVTRSKRRNQNEDPAADLKIAALKAEIEDIQEAHEAENNLDDMCEYMSNLGTCVAVGPIEISQPHMRWNDGQEQIDPEDVHKPMWQLYDPKEVYPDPNAKKPQQLEYVHFHHIMSKHQLRSLQEDDTFIPEEIADLIDELGPDGNWAANLKRWEIVPTPTNVANAQLSGFCVWRRIGILTKEALEDLHEKFPKTKALAGLSLEQRKTMADSMWEIWFCDKHVLKIAKRTFQPQKMPVYFIPFRRDPASIFGVGAGESALEVVEMLTNITRGIEDSINDTSGFQVMIDAGMVQNTDLRVQGRKTWIYRSKGKREDAQNHKPVDFFTVPSNLEQLLACFKQFEAMVPICTGFLEMANGQDLGSGIRTDAMLNALWDSLEEFIKDVVGNVDRYWWKPFLRDCYQWIQFCYPDKDKYKVEADLQVQGVRGALKREVVGRKLMDFWKITQQFGASKWIDQIEIIKGITEGIGIEEERAILTPQQYVEAMQLEIQQKQMLEEAGAAPQTKERAHASNRDTAMELFKQSMAQGKDGLTPSIAIPAAHKLFDMLGMTKDPMTLAGLSVWAKTLAEQYKAAGVATPQEAAALEIPAPAQKPPVAPQPAALGQPPSSHPALPNGGPR